MSNIIETKQKAAVKAVRGPARRSPKGEDGTKTRNSSRQTIEVEIVKAEIVQNGQVFGGKVKKRIARPPTCPAKRGTRRREGEDGNAKRKKIAKFAQANY